MLVALRRMQRALDRSHEKGETFPAVVSIAAVDCDRAIAAAARAGIKAD
jgi:hypothetical protein